MTNTVYNVDQLLEIGSIWQKNEHGCEVSFFASGESQTYQVSNEKLMRRDHRLVHVLSHWQRALALQQVVPYIHSEAIEATLLFWSDPLWMKNVQGSMFAISSIDEVEIVDHPDRTDIWVHAEVYNLAKAGDIEYATGKYEHLVSVRVESIDEQYPGWRTRLDIADSLGGGDLLYRTYVFNKTPILAPTDSPLPDNMA